MKNEIITIKPTKIGNERKIIDKSGLRLKAIKIDWMSNNPMRGMETPEGYALRMNEALKIKK